MVWLRSSQLKIRQIQEKISRRAGRDRMRAGRPRSQANPVGEPEPGRQAVAAP